MPVFNKTGELEGLEVAGFEPTIQALKELVNEQGLSMEDALKPFTITPAKGIGVYPFRGTIAEQSYADIVLMDENMEIRDVWVNGVPFMRDYQLLKKGAFE